MNEELCREMGKQVRDFESDRDSHIHKMPESRGTRVSFWGEKGRRVGEMIGQILEGQAKG